MLSKPSIPKLRKEGAILSKYSEKPPEKLLTSIINKA